MTSEGWVPEAKLEEIRRDLQSAIAQDANGLGIGLPAYPTGPQMEFTLKKATTTGHVPHVVNHPRHYNVHPSGIECFEVVRLCHFDLGNGIKYVWRYEDKNGDEDLKKARVYLRDLIEHELPRYPTRKARRLLDKVIAADDVAVRRDLLDHIRHGRVARAVEYITEIVGADD